ncbi:NADH dehydrogenase [ubiquinone] 1 beta subcomplex subunit 8, mitochondrial [Cynoglossus semilaevis]|nr:NADH dehydrogenase [ubiquinone] 1 beta subcomplex subunit 8, mitochondrial [Cynoglossus semilaevis]
MAGVGFRRLAQALRSRRSCGVSLSLSGCRAGSSMGKDTLPGPYVKTPEERAAAAAKYNMTIHDYKPYDDNGDGTGDYPHLPDRSQHERDPWYTWDHPDLRRNWGEPMHWNFDMYIRTRVDTSPTVLPWRKMNKQLWGFLGFMLVLFILGENFKSYTPVLPKQYPYNGLYIEKGGDPEKQPEEEKHYEI